MITTLEQPGKTHTIQNECAEVSKCGIGDAYFTSNPIGNGNTLVIIPEISSKSKPSEKFQIARRERIVHELKHSFDEHIDKKIYKLGKETFKRHDKVNNVEVWEIEAVQMGNEIRNANCQENKKGYEKEAIKPENQNVNSSTLSNNEETKK